MITEAIKQLVEGRDLSGEEAHAAMMQVMSGDASQAQIAGFVVALRMKGETPDEIAGCARAMRAHATPSIPSRDGLVDTCGTGGDGAETFNISTSAALVAAGAGVAIAKHGNRAVSSRCGSADVLEALGVRIDLSPERRCQEHRRGRIRVPVRAGPPSGDAPRRPGSPRARRAHGVQCAWPTDQPRGRAPPGDRRVRTPPGRADRPGACPAGGRPCPGGARRRRPGRAHSHRREHDGRGA